MGSIKLGWAQRDITPERHVNLFGYPHRRLTNTVRDPVTVTALFIGSGKDYAILVSCDLCVIYQQTVERCRKHIEKKIPQVDPLKIIFNAIHTHDAPGLASWVYPPVPEGAMSPDEYSVFFAERVTEAVREAWKNQKAGSVAWGYGQAVAGHNRRTVYFASGKGGSSDSAANERSEMYGMTDDPLFSHVEGYEDHGVDILFTFDTKKELTGVVVNLACPSQETEGLKEISADFWHETRNELRKKFGKNLKVLPQCSAAGDLSPHRLLNRKACDRMLKLKNVTMREEIARRISSAVEEVFPYAIKDIRNNVSFKHVTGNLKLKRKKVSLAEFREVKKEYEKLMKEQPGIPDGEYEKFSYLRRCRTAMERYKLQKSDPGYPAEVHVIRIGDIAIVTNPFELYLDYGLRIKARSPFVQTFIVELSNGFGCYLPTQRAVRAGGYSATVYENNVGPEGGQQLVEMTLQMLRQVSKEKDAKS